MYINFIYFIYFLRWVVYLVGKQSFFRQSQVTPTLWHFGIFWLICSHFSLIENIGCFIVFKVSWISQLKRYLIELNIDYWLLTTSVTFGVTVTWCWYISLVVTVKLPETGFCLVRFANANNRYTVNKYPLAKIKIIIGIFP